MTTYVSQSGSDAAADSGAPQDCECEFCSPEPEPIPAPWERTGDPEHDLRPLSMSAEATDSAEAADSVEADETPTLSLVPLSPR